MEGQQGLFHMPGFLLQWRDVMVGRFSAFPLGHLYACSLPWLAADKASLLSMVAAQPVGP